MPSITYPHCCYNVSQTRILVFAEGLSASPLSALNQADWRTFHTTASASRSLLKSKHHSRSQLLLFPPRPRKMKEPILLFLPLSGSNTLCHFSFPVVSLAKTRTDGWRDVTLSIPCSLLQSRETRCLSHGHTLLKTPSHDGVREFRGRAFCQPATHGSHVSDMHADHMRWEILLQCECEAVLHGCRGSQSGGVGHWHVTLGI